MTIRVFREQRNRFVRKERYLNIIRLFLDARRHRQIPSKFPGEVIFHLV